MAQEEDSTSNNIQIIQDKGFAHFNYSALKAGARIEQASKAHNGLHSAQGAFGVAPFLQSQWRENIVVQDQSNRLYLVV